MAKHPRATKPTAAPPVARGPGDPSTASGPADQGVPIADNQHSLEAGLRGPTLLEDLILREKITHFDHQRIPERIVPARGSAAHGVFQSDEPLQRDTKTALFAEAGRETPVFVRFPTVLGERGSADTARDVRGFAVKFYTDEGNWDLVGNSIPVLFIEDAMKFPDLVHAAEPEPHFGVPQAGTAHYTFWDFASLMPEITHMRIWVMSDRAIPRSYRLAEAIAVGLGMDPLPAPLPKALPTDVTPEVTESSAISLTARPGGGIRGKRVANSRCRHRGRDLAPRRAVGSSRGWRDPTHGRGQARSGGDVRGRCAARHHG